MMTGYARVSTDEQTLDLQENAMKYAGCDPVFVDKVSGVSGDNYAGGVVRGGRLASSGKPRGLGQSPDSTMLAYIQPLAPPHSPASGAAQSRRRKGFVTVSHGVGVNHR